MLTLVSALGFSSTAWAQGCPPAGARYVSDNFVRVSHLTSLGGAKDDTLGCRWRRDEDGQVIWLSLGPTMKPLAQAGATSGSAKPAPNTAAATPAGAITGGVYECDTPINIGGMIQGTPATGPMFGVTGPGTYRDFDGGTGSFQLADSILTMTSGPLKGTRYQRQSDTVFRPLNAAGKTGPIICRLNRSKPLTGRW
jgi:hypothetical protein